MGSAESQKPKQPREGIYSSSRLERSITVIAITIASIGLGYLWNGKAMGQALEAVTAGDARGFFEHRGYRATAHLL